MPGRKFSVEEKPAILTEAEANGIARSIHGHGIYSPGPLPGKQFSTISGKASYAISGRAALSICKRIEG